MGHFEKNSVVLRLQLLVFGTTNTRFLLGPKGSELLFFSFFSCRDLVIIDFFGNLKRAIKLVLNSPTRLSTVVSVGLLRIRYESKFWKKIFLMVHRGVELGSWCSRGEHSNN